MPLVRILELFGGIGAMTQALKKLNVNFEIADYVEIDKYAVASYNAINGTHFEPQDITEWNKDIDVDLIMHGSPCQDISLAGQQAGADEGSGTRSSLMYETIRIVKKLKPKYVIWENVKNLISKKHKHNFDRYLQALSEGGYTNYWQVLNAKDYGIPQNRERVFTISIRNDIDKGYEFPPKQELKLRLKDLLEDEVDGKYYLSEKMINFFYKNEQKQIEKGNGFRFGVTDGNVVAKAVTTRAGSRMDDNFIKIKNATKKGYLEAYEGDGVDISSRMQWHRGTVQKEMSQTLDTSGNDRGVVVGAYTRDFGSKGKVQDKDYCDTLTASMGEGGGNVPLYKTENKRIISLADNIEDKDNTYFMDIYNQKNIDNMSGTLKSGMDHQQGNIVYSDLCIRKLTPKECWRLMGFDDEAFEKAQQVNSNTQLYKQAGNSIVVNVLEAIFKELLGG